MVGRTGQAISLSVSSSRVSTLPRAAAERIAAADVILLNVDGLSVPVPQQALYDAASEIRLATEAHVRWTDCVSAVEIVLGAMQRAGALCFCPSEMDIGNPDTEDTPSKK